MKYHAQPDGDDIAFSSGGSWLNHEIELFDQTYSSTHAQLIVWIQIPFLSTSVNTSITMYYGNSSITFIPTYNPLYLPRYNYTDLNEYIGNYTLFFNGTQEDGEDFIFINLTNKNIVV